ncbi:hypothetical protein [Chitinophaga sp. W3I9]|uniref:hypothetical protein n=1 Tax=Chitinophaga sp. W3I9 TaxID=3373924 RepID=UPI003D2322C4
MNVINRLLLLVLLMLLHHVAYPQYFLNLTESGVREEVKTAFGKGIEMKQAVRAGNTYTLTWNTQDYEWSILFNERRISKVLIVFPKTQESLNIYVQNLNKTCVPISNTDWKSYIRDRVYKVEMRYIAEVSELSFFTFTRLE